MKMKNALERPELTMPEAEAERVRDAYASARVILEYGSGGSTVMASEMAGKQVFSVESDAEWASMMKGWFAANPPMEGTGVTIHHVDIGTTRKWGHPVDESGWQRYAQYPLGIWERRGIPHPDVVLVDGRFRIGCALATAFKISRPVRLLFDDYGLRDRYLQVEEFLGTPERIGRMAEFYVTPQPVPADKLLKIIRFMTRS